MQNSSCTAACPSAGVCSNYYPLSTQCRTRTCVSDHTHTHTSLQWDCVGVWVDMHTFKGSWSKVKVNATCIYMYVWRVLEYVAYVCACVCGMWALQLPIHVRCHYSHGPLHFSYSLRHYVQQGALFIEISAHWVSCDFVSRWYIRSRSHPQAYPANTLPWDLPSSSVCQTKPMPTDSTSRWLSPSLHAKDCSSTWL